MKYTNNTIRINIFFILGVVLLFGLFFVKLGVVALEDEVEGTNVAKLAESRSVATRTLTAKRGNILDSDGHYLAQNMNSYNVIAMLSETRTTDERYPKHVVDKNLTAEKLSEVLLPLNKKMTKDYIYKLLDQKNLYQTNLGPGGNGITEQVKKKIEELALPGIEFEKSLKRYYPSGDFASYIIGYAKTDDEGNTKGELGIEAFCDRYLKGKNGTITYQRDAYGYQMANSKYTYTTPAEDGFDVYLTIDQHVQMFLNNAVKKLTDFGPEWITLTVADAKTGAIIGSSSSPSFDSNKLNIVDYNNPLTSYAFEPGSTMKIFSFMTAMELGKYNGSKTYKSGTIKVGDYTIHDWNKVGWGDITYDVGFTYSSNVAAILLSEQITKKNMIEFYSNLGFGSLTGIELSGELKGDINIDHISEVASASYGQGIMTTPIQMIQALSVLTNDGTVLKPYVIDKIVDPNKNKVVYQGKRTEVKKVYSTSTVNKITELMDMTVNGSDGRATGKVYHTDAVRLIGKTGTANYSKDGKYVTGSTNNIRSFAGVFPRDNPEYIIYIAIKDFKGASKDIGSVIQGLVESVAKYKNLDERVSDLDPSKIVEVPNVLNKSVDTSVASLSAKGVTSVVIGDGNVVVEQYPKKGMNISQKTKVFLVTNGNKLVMPDMNGWSSHEVIDFCKLVGVKYNLEGDGYGYVESVNIPAGSPIDANTVINVSLKKQEPESLVEGGL